MNFGISKSLIYLSRIFTACSFNISKLKTTEDPNLYNGEKKDNFSFLISLRLSSRGI